MSTNNRVLRSGANTSQVSSSPSAVQPRTPHTRNCLLSPPSIALSYPNILRPTGAPYSLCLLWLGDSNRVKSFRYASKKVSADNEDEDMDKDDYVEHRARAAHTLNAPHAGPIALLENGAKLIRGGKGEIGVWDVDSLPTHGPKGNTRIGKKIRTDDTWRDVDDYIEPSEGAPPNSSISFSVPTSNSASSSFSSLAADPFDISSWTQSPSDAKTMIASKEKSYSCISIDLAAGGKVGMMYLGHGGDVTAFSTSDSDDPRGFVTSASDGVVRLWDVREPLPKLSIDVGWKMEACDAVVYMHIQGVPLIFTGGDRSECVKAWDPRSSTRNCIYELSTGNNSVTSLAWDAPRSTLYAATTCPYIDRMGRTHEYRAARSANAAKRAREGGDSDDNEDDESVDEEDEDDEEFEGRGWPRNAYHDEQYFGYLWDSGDHRLIKYSFSENADPKVLPMDGGTRPDLDGNGWGGLF